jgi:hypothetical protein
VITTLLLTFNPILAWKRIALARRTWVYVFLSNTLPWLLFGSVVEGYGLMRWGKTRGEFAQAYHLTGREAVVFETIQTLIWLGVVFFGAWLMKSLARTFPRGRPFTPTFTAIAYSLSPLLMLRALDGIPVWPGLGWGIGIFLFLEILYNGVPPLIEPDPPQAFGYYLSNALVLLLLTAVIRFASILYLMGKFPGFSTVFPN